MDNEQTFVTTGRSDFYHASEDCAALKRGQKAAESNGWQRHDLIPWTPESGLKRDPCKMCTQQSR